jgi:hypothetical protein
MLTTQERQDIFFEVLSRLIPDARVRSMPTSPAEIYSPRTTLQDVLDRLGDLPPASAVVGICEDGLPLLFDFAEPSPGSILIQGEHPAANTRLLQTILASAAALNPPDKLRFTIITPNPGEYQTFERSDHCRAILSSFDRVSSELVIELAEITEQRRYGRNRGGVEILALDDLPAFVQNNDYEVNAYLKWLLKYGPRSKVWPAATVKNAQAWRMEDGLSEAFGTIFNGQTSSNLLENGSPAEVSVQPGTHTSGMFTTTIDREWVRFWVPE